ncbi:lantibiotic dehydratase [Micromonospora terminaliae]|uniref:Lantibiotic dehydratase n=1 Tax=Micromonospora terminaliae TaxID=1914461 RepID=A0AAJ2ZJI5_9ACTN|nr:lantibiotic dehydratase [Micromonospora terminaliae]NES30188.1 lantibiotic dehydratase [Micromonospora terminaliae]QGL47039.1 lantibiotic dehydratase [Micromonospora terminaliae]
MTAEHLLRLGGSDWSIWKQSVLRSAGFPAADVGRLSNVELAAAADRCATGEGSRNDYQAAYERATTQLSEQIRRIARDPTFREAVAWQNRALIADCVDKAAAGEPRNVRGRNHESAIASYWQRYCVKNDTIGFFGPVGWANWSSDDAATRVTPGPDLLARRTTYLEVWAVDAVARALEQDPKLIPWLPPRRINSFDLVGRTLHRSSRPPVLLTEAEAELVGLCDGTRTAREIAEEILWSGHPELCTEQDVLDQLVALRDRGLLHLGLEVAVSAHPERELIERLERVGDPVVREQVLTRVGRLLHARDAVAAAAGDEAKLVAALDQAARVFEEIAGVQAARRPGQTYAGRTILYEDTVRDVDVHFGAAVLEALAPPLALLLQSARWFVAEVTREYRKVFDEAYELVRARSGDAPPSLAAVVAAATPQLFFSLRELPRPVATVAEELQRRWQEILRPSPDTPCHQVRAEDITERVAELFAAPEPAWAAAVHHAPDLMIAADGPEAVARGEFLLVLGELHLASNTVESRLFVEQHEDPSWLFRADEADHRDRRVYLSSPKHWEAVNSRTYPPSALLSPRYTYWSLHPDAGGTPGEPLPAARLVVERSDGRLEVRTRDGARRFDLLEVVGELLSAATVNGFKPLPPAAHRPRVTIDRLVLARESWTLDATDLRWASIKKEPDRFLAARAWRAELGLPERGFYKVPVEDKPVFVDFTSLVLVNLFAKAVRRTAEARQTTFTISEMLPDISQTWLTDGDGAGYTAEVRVVAVDPAAGATAVDPLIDGTRARPGAAGPESTDPRTGRNE